MGVVPRDEILHERCVARRDAVRDNRGDRRGEVGTVPRGDLRGREGGGAVDEVVLRRRAIGEKAKLVRIAALHIADERLQPGSDRRYVTGDLDRISRSGLLDDGGDDKCRENRQQTDCDDRLDQRKAIADSR